MAVNVRASFLACKYGLPHMNDGGSILMLAPGPVDNDVQTDIENGLGAVIGIDATEMINRDIPLGRHARAEEIARTALFLVSDASSFSTGGV